MNLSDFEDDIIRKKKNRISVKSIDPEEDIEYFDIEEKIDKDSKFKLLPIGIIIFLILLGIVLTVLCG